jgi:HSP20 family protein
VSFLSHTKFYGEFAANAEARSEARAKARGYCDQSALDSDKEEKMAMRDLIPWTRSRDFMPDFWRDERTSPFLTLHREMNRLMDEMFRSFTSAPQVPRADFMSTSWPKIEVSESEKQITVTAEIPGMEEKDVELLLRDGNLVIRGEMKSETEEKERQWSERFYGRFERHIPVGSDIDEEKVEASFKKGVLTITCPKTPRAQEKAKRIAINAPTKH